MSQNKSQGRRRRFLVARPVQGSLVFRFICYWAAFCLLAMLVGITIAYFRNLITGSQYGFRDSLRDQAPFLISAIVLMPILVNDLVRFSQRFTGPICHLQNEIRRFNAGAEFNPVQFRTADFWQDLPADFNQFALRMNSCASLDPAQAGSSSPDDEELAESGRGEKLQERSNGTLVADTASS